ncbi:flagellar basal body-associated protein FliL [Roseinatronobacter alkalisoli]|uniref:Flagellar basal body-associated protein FliL n=1 Tax=Roseinatronobacter alkalisoli TaxID=3028235 RepID=A0ABT5T5A9_9RHOB|nr:flagellar basal body-associated protein FliL [Roseinatronobacter sp. HJB301]MDD7970159.1 flagellar basal body-associated protein FliL [Roseinatronobacter sp. HJB301]
MAKLIPILLIVFGLAGGVGAGLWLRPVPEPSATAQQAVPLPESRRENTVLHDMSNQFMVPLLEGDRIVWVIVISLTLEVDGAHMDAVIRNEPRLRDRFLQAMFDHANSGGFDGMFTSNNNMNLLRQALLETGQNLLGRDAVAGVLITDILRSGT